MITKNTEREEHLRRYCEQECWNNEVRKRIPKTSGEDHERMTRLIAQAEKSEYLRAFCATFVPNMQMLMRGGA